MLNTRLLALPVVAIWSAIVPAGLALYSESCPQGQVYLHGQDHTASHCTVSVVQPRSVLRNAAVMNGVDVLEHDHFKELRASDPSTLRTVGIITNHTGFDVEGRRTIDVLAEAPGIRLTAIFSPEHGITGELDVGPPVGNSVDRTTGVPVYSIYGETAASRHPPENVLKKLNVLVIDIQDIGSRFYTYESTLGYALESAAATGTEVVVLDRPNPLTGIYVQGPVSDGNHLSFVNYTTEPIRHGMTMGELARMFNSERRINAKTHRGSRPGLGARRLV